MKLVLITCMTFVIPAIAPAQPADTVLASYIQQALSSNVTLQNEALNYELSLEALKEAKATFFPTLTFYTAYQTGDGQNMLGIDANEELDPFLQNLDLINNTLASAFPDYPDLPSYSGDNSDYNQAFNQQFQTNMTLTLPVFNAAIIHNYEIKKSMAQVDQLSTEDYKAELVKEVKVAYYQWLQAREQVAILQNMLEVTAENERTNKSLYLHQKATKDVYLSARASHSESQQELTNAQKQAVLAQAYFNFLLNKPYDATVMPPTAEIAVTPLTKPLADYQEAALMHRSDLKQVQQLQIINEGQIKLQKSAYLPQINVSAEAGYRGQDVMIDTDHDYYMVGAQLKWDLFTFGKNNAKVEQAKIDKRITENNEEALVRQIQMEVVEAYLEVQSAFESLTSAQSEVKYKAEETKLKRKKYALGQLNYLELDVAETDYQNALLQALATKFNVLIQKAELERATGNYDISHD